MNYLELLSNANIVTFSRTTNIVMLFLPEGPFQRKAYRFERIGNRVMGDVCAMDRDKSTGPYTERSRKNIGVDHRRGFKALVDGIDAMADKIDKNRSRLRFTIYRDNNEIF